ncbi:MAG TPA: tRNA (adenosine(37)-N6)-dimethylallyltransferase MiaA [Chitinophagaceae bacterium]|nr:tRNA (adenosine(37)-N6)-dimethylallyltransferase MiaA [Chitinophagaceae bacterium]
MIQESAKTVIVVVGPTAVGKTAAAIALAERLGTEILSADSRQCYRELDIGVARPAPGELARVPHHFIASHSIRDTVHAAEFEWYGMQKAQEIFSRHNQLILAGGTGLYVRAFCEGLDDIPEVPGSVRDRVREGYRAFGLAWLQQEVARKDPAFLRHGEMKNPHRLLRALEVAESTGKSILEFRKRQPRQRDFNLVKIGLELAPDLLWRNIQVRTQAMVQRGLVEEVVNLVPHRQLNALQTVGYAEIFEYLDGRFSLEEAVGRIALHTRQYAKRQLTWFRKDPSITWFAPEDLEGMMNFLHTKFIE